MSQSRSWIPATRKIAVLRANALGDYVFAQPALYALRSAYPQAEIVLLGKPWHIDYIAGRPGPVNRVIAVPRYKGVSEPDTWTGQDPRAEDFFAQMQAERFDLALQMHGGGGNSNPFVARLGARVTAGMRAPGAPPLDRWMPYIYWQHEILRLLEVASLVGASPVMLEPRIEVTQRDLDESYRALPLTAAPFVVLHPGASDPRRRWSAQSFAAVGDGLAREGYQVIVVGIPDEQAVVQEVVGAMRQPALDLCGRLSLHALTGLLKRASLAVANDSGPRHLAEAVGAPTVSIFWCGNLINAGSAFRTIHRPHLSWRLDCPICGRNTIHDPCGHAVSFVDDVRVDEVLESALDVLRITREELGPAQVAQHSAPVIDPTPPRDPFQPGLINELASPPRKVVVLRASRIGDFINAAPAFRALRSGLPNAELTLITLPMLEDLARRLELFDRILPFPGYPGLAEQFFEPGRALDFFQAMQAEHFDLAIQMQGSGVYANPFTLMLGAKHTTGFIRPGDPPGRLSAALPFPGGHEARRNLDLIEFLGLPGGELRPEFPLWPEDHQAAEALLAPAPRPWIGIHTSARDATRRWPIQRFAQAAARLQRIHGGTVILIGEQRDRAGMAAALDDVHAPTLNLAGCATLPVTGAVIARLNIFLTNDTGPAHIAYAAGAPTVTIFGGGEPERNGPALPGPFRVLAYPIDCRPCETGACPIGLQCLEHISVEQVVEKAEEVGRF